MTEHQVPQMYRPTKEVNMEGPDLTPDPSDDTVVDDDTGRRDFILGMTIGCVMAFGSLALMIIFSIT